MCNVINIGKALGGHITIEHQRDASIRATEIVIVNTTTSGVETGVVVIAYDNGGLTVGKPFGLTKGQDIHLGDLCNKECCKYVQDCDYCGELIADHGDRCFNKRDIFPGF
jgi:hypothetical protein